MQVEDLLQYGIVREHGAKATLPIEFWSAMESGKRISQGVCIPLGTML